MFRLDAEGATKLSEKTRTLLVGVEMPLRWSWRLRARRSPNLNHHVSGLILGKSLRVHA